MNPHVDLSQLSVRREAAEAANTDQLGPRPRHLFTRYVLPVGVLLGFAVVVAWAARDSLLPAKEVTVVPVLVTRTLEQQAGTPLFTSAGWIEPSPYPTQVTALAEGVVEKLLVIEGQEVKKGEPVAELIRRDSELAVTHVHAEVEMRAADLESARAQLTAAETKLAQPVQLDAALSETEAMLARAQTELGNLSLQIEAADARVKIVKSDLDGKKEVGEAIITRRAIQRAESEYDSAVAMRDELKQRGPRLQKEIDALTRRKDAVAKQRELKTDEIRAVAEAKSLVASAEAKLHQVMAEEDIAKLRLERMIVKSPATGRVLARVAREGTRLMGLKSESDQDSSTVVTLYNPDKLQVRADVRLEDVPRLRPNQPVKIETAASSQTLDGHILVVTSSADIQKNTLQVKVAIDHPPPQIKPEMLVKVTFLAMTEDQPKSDAQKQKERIYVPKSLVGSDDAGNFVWIADQAANVARRRPVKTGGNGRENSIEVEGLSPADKVIAGGRDGLSDSQRIHIKGEDHGAG